MKSELSPSQRLRRRRARREKVRDRARRGLSLLPSLLTLANLVCGFFAIVHVGAVQWTDGAPIPQDSFQIAAWAILLAMVFDMLDGRVARMTESTSEFGAQLDSLADAVTFGVAPAVMVAMLHAMGRYEFGEPFWSKMAWVFGAAYACGAVVRLARFNVDTESAEEEAHLSFKGLPSPAAAGVIASLVLLHGYLLSDRSDPRLAWIEPTWIELMGHRLLDLLPFIALGTGYLMVSRFEYPHFANKYLKGRKPAEYLTAAIFLGVLAALFFQVVAALIFCGFALSGPLRALRAWWQGPAAAAADKATMREAQPLPPPDASEQRAADPELPAAGEPWAEEPLDPDPAPLS